MTAFCKYLFVRRFPAAFCLQHFASSILPAAFCQNLSSIILPGVVFQQHFSAAFESNKGIIAFCQYLLALTAFDSNQGIILQAALFKHYLTSNFSTAFVPSIVRPAFCQQHFVNSIFAA